ncbi:MAG: response regulator transcription factor [Nitriliruptorales bacterium]|nr:response regulator transcription factor [Nitriliruptorales bacterium]
MARVLLVEDDPAIRSAVLRELGSRGHAVDHVDAGLPALEALVGDEPEVVVLDLGLPDVDGTRVLEMLRAVSDVPVIVATARDDEAGIVEVLNAGADDYVVKPYSAAQLEARIRAVLRRASDEAAEQRFEVGDLTVDVGAHRATLGGDELELSRLEFSLLAYLAEHAGEVVSKRELLAEVWRQPYGGSDRTVDVHLSWLRRKLGETAAEPRYLHTVRGVGIRLSPP